MSKEKNRWNWQWERLKNEEKKIFLDWIRPTRLEDFRNKLVLDAGCGNAGYAKMVARYARKVVAVDKYAVESAKKNTEGWDNIEVFAGDVETFRYKEKFEAIYCVGVLHHLKSPKKGFLNLIKNLKKGGFINIWVYAREGNWFMVHVIEPLKRLILLRLPLPILKILAYLLTGILYLLAWTIFLLPVNFPYTQYLAKFRQHSFGRNLMNVFDKLNAPLTHWISKRQIKDWFKDLDGVVIRHYNKISWSGFGFK